MSLRKSNSVKRILALMSITIFTGCATVGESFTFKGPESIQIGKTTKQDILTAYGNPFRTGYEDGKLKWSYNIYHYRVFGDSDTKDFAITFAKNGTVDSYTYSTSDPEDVKKSVSN